MARFLFCSYATPGLLFPHIRIAEQLRAQGHRIAFITDISRTELLGSRGFYRIKRSDTDGPSFQIGLWSNPLEVALQYKHTCHAIKEFRPSVIVSNELGMGALLAARALSLPIAVLGSLAYLWPSKNITASRHASWRYADARRLLDEACYKLALPQFDSGNDHPLLGDLFFLRSAPFFEIHDAYLPSKVHYIGSYLGTVQSCDPELSAWIARQKSSGKRIIYLQFGRSFGRPSSLRVVKSALASIGAAVIAVTGRSDEAFGDVPKDFLVRSHAPEDLIIKESLGVISTANSTTILGSIEAEAPGVVFPSGGETPDIADRCMRAGTAICLNSDISHSYMSDCLEHAFTDRKIKQSCHLVREAFRKIGACAAEDLLETLATTGIIPLRALA